jgi:hypothetical protein
MTVPTTQRLPIAAMALLVGVGTVAEIYAASRGAEISRNAGQLWYVCFSYAVAWWIEIDRKAKTIGAPFEYSAFMFFSWPLLAPYYLFKSRRWRGLALGLGLIVFSFIPDIAAFSIYYLVVDQ